MSPKASTIQWDRNTSFLLKGSPGFGKTIAACSAAIYGDVFLAYIDKRAPVEVLTYFKTHRPELLERIEYECYGSHNINDYLNKLIKLQSDCRYAAVITDSVTSLTSAAVNWSMGFRDPKGGKKDKVANNTPQIIPDWDEYKVETSLVTQALDICKMLNTINIWTAHPLPTMRVEGNSGRVDSITKSSSIVSYGAKVGAIVPGAFSEVYHFGRQGSKRIVWTDMVGDDFARTSLLLPKSFDITDKLFFEVWEELVKQGMETGGLNEVKSSNNVLSVDFGKENSGPSKWKV